MAFIFVNDTPAPVPTTAADIPAGGAFLYNNVIYGKSADGVQAINLTNGMDLNPITNFGAAPVIRMDLTELHGHAHI